MMAFMHVAHAHKVLRGTWHMLVSPHSGMFVVKRKYWVHKKTYTWHLAHAVPGTLFTSLHFFTYYIHSYIHVCTCVATCMYAYYMDDASYICSSTCRDADLVAHHASSVAWFTHMPRYLSIGFERVAWCNSVYAQLRTTKLPTHIV